MKTTLVSILFVVSSTINLYAEQAKAQPSAFGSFFPLIIIFFIFYFLLIRPQQKKAKEHQKMLNALKKDDKIITNGGIHATVVGLKGNTVEIKIAEGVKVLIDKSAVGNVLQATQDQAVTPEIVK